MNQHEKLINYLKTKGKTHSWRELAEMFNILPGPTNKQRSDKVRKLFNKINTNLPGVAGEVFKVKLEKDFFKNAFEDEKVLVLDSSGDVVDFFDSYDTYKRSKKNISNKNIRHLKTKRVAPYLNGNPDNVLIIGDIHEPFCLDGYLEFCREQQEKFNCGTVVFIGDIIDHHFSSFHPTDPDGFGGGEELERAINKLQSWYYTFPEAVVTIGNHDRIVARKLYSSGISMRWVRPIQEVLNVPNWKFVEEFEYNGVLYIHGEMGTAKKKAADEGISCVQGHNHTEAYVDFAVGRNTHRFAMQVGTGIDFEAYAFAYAQRGKKPITSCGVVLEGKYPFLIPNYQ